ncbi:hypothetical protein A9Q87_12220 [Flavobacteriales bacterium 34_180_T64]|nr:hypothetical protein A9Q87_12220 [Flavobacteriales bacterium 34_180_T64]
MLIGLATVAAAGQVSATRGNDLKNTARYRFAEPIVFIERGVEFLIFPDGSFDFNTEIEANFSDSYYRTSNSRRGTVNSTYGTPGTLSRIHYSRPRSKGVIITHDGQGRVRRIGNVFINYNRHGQIKRAGSVYMSYQRGNDRLKQVGGLRVNYNRWGEIVHIAGVVNHYNSQFNCGIGYNHSNYAFNDTHYDDDFYYYRKKGKVKKHKKRNAIK